MNALKEWWEQASSRDQLSLVICGACIALYLLFVGVYKPVQIMRDTPVSQNEAQLASLARVRSLAAQVIQQKKSGKANNKKSTNIESLVQRSLAPNNLSVSSMSAVGNSGVRIRFDEARFENLLNWLYEMEVRNGLLIKDISVSGSSTPGTVTANLRLLKE